MQSAINKTDAYHEAGHAVIGILQGFRLESAPGLEEIDVFPHCKWEKWNIRARQAEQDQALAKDFTRRHALMCVAAEFSEALLCNENNRESADAIHCDYLDPEVIRKNAGYEYFGLNGRPQLRLEAKSMVEQNKDAIIRVGESLAAGNVLAHDYVVRLMETPIRTPVE